MYFLRNYGLKETVKMLILRSYRHIKQKKLDLSSEQIIQVNGSDFLLRPNDQGISAELLAFGIHEPLSTSIISKILNKGMTCIDMSANIGYFATLESNLVRDTGLVLAIEPSPVNFGYLKKNSKLHSLSNIQVFNFAFSDKNDSSNFLLDEKSNQSRLIDKNVIPTSNEKIIKVETKTLDSFVSEQVLTRLDFLRMDIEGYELVVYSGMSEIIKKFKPMILVEFHKYSLGKNNSIVFLNKLKSEGYEISSFIPRGLDDPMMAKMKFIKQLTIDHLIKQIKNNNSPGVFSLLLMPKLRKTHE